MSRRKPKKVSKAPVAYPEAAGPSEAPVEQKPVFFHRGRRIVREQYGRISDGYERRSLSYGKQTYF